MVKEAIGLYEKALEIDPDSGEIYYNLGIAYNDMGDEERRDAAFKKAEQLGVRR
jgi:tetratricopeptide (TPR) repeat protein